MSTTNKLSCAFDLRRAELANEFDRLQPRLRAEARRVEAAVDAVLADHQGAV